MNLFQCGYFNIHMLIKWLGDNEQTGVIEYLVNKLYSETYQDLDLYLPQICFLILTKKNDDCVIAL
jgi:phosphatidylinositol 4-kinase